MDKQKLKHKWRMLKWRGKRTFSWKRFKYLGTNLCRCLHGQWLFDAQYLSWRGNRKIRIFLDGQDVTEDTNAVLCSCFPHHGRQGWARLIQYDDDGHIRVANHTPGPLMKTVHGLVRWDIKR